MTTYSSQPAEAASHDTYIRSTAADTNYDAVDYLHCGETNAGAAVFRTILRFDLSSISPAAIISSAVLSLWVQSDLSTNARDKSLFRILRNDVEEQATWNSWKTGSAWSTAGCGSNGNDADLTNVWAVTNMGSAVAPDTEVQWTFTATGLTELTKMINGTYTNYGWLLKTTTETDDCYVFWSSNYATASKRPKLVIEYIVPLYPKVQVI